MAIKTNKAIKISQKHLLGIQDLSINDVNLILDEAHDFIKVNQSKNKKIDINHYNFKSLPLSYYNKLRRVYLPKNCANKIFTVDDREI